MSQWDMVAIIIVTFLAGMFLGGGVAILTIKILTGPTIDEEMEEVMNKHYKEKDMEGKADDIN